MRSYVDASPRVDRISRPSSSFVCSERLRPGNNTSFPMPLPPLPLELRESPKTCSWSPFLDAECRCNAIQDIIMSSIYTRCLESRVFQIRAKGISVNSKSVHRIECVNGVRRRSRRQNAEEASSPVEGQHQGVGCEKRSSSRSEGLKN